MDQEKKPLQFCFRVTEDQLTRWGQRAKEDGRSLSAWIRWKLNQACRAAH